MDFFLTHPQGSCLIPNNKQLVSFLFKKIRSQLPLCWSRLPAAAQEMSLRFSPKKLYSQGGTRPDLREWWESSLPLSYSTSRSLPTGSDTKLPFLNSSLYCYAFSLLQFSVTILQLMRKRGHGEAIIQNRNKRRK